MNVYMRKPGFSGTKLWLKLHKICSVLLVFHARISFSSKTFLPLSIQKKKKNLKPWMMFFFFIFWLFNCHSVGTFGFRGFFFFCEALSHQMDISMSNKNTLITSVPFLKNEILLIQSHRLTTNCAEGLYELQMTSVAVFCLTGNTAACWAKMTITNPVDWAGRLSGSS